MNTKEIHNWYKRVKRVTKRSKETGDQVYEALNKAKFYDPRGNGNKAYKRKKQIEKAYK